MFCKKCGKELRPDAIFCSSCGAGVGEEGKQQKGPTAASAKPSSQRPQPPPTKKGWSTKKKVLVATVTFVVAFFVLVGICLAAARPWETVDDDSTTYSLNDEVTVGKAVWELLDVKDRGSVLLASESEWIYGEDKTTSGKFIEITMQVTNTGTITEDVWSEPNLIDSKGTTFKPADGVLLWIPDENEAIFQSLQPRITREFIWIYEVPKDATGLKVQVEDISVWSTKEALIDLGP